MPSDFQLESTIICDRRVNESRLALSAAWRNLLAGLRGQTITTTRLAALMNMETRSAYLACKRLAKFGLVSVIPPEKSGQPSTIIINSKLQFFKK